MEQSIRLRFTSQQLKAMILPLFFEQLLIVLVGVADTIVVSYAGEAAVSGVSLVNQFNTIFIYLFTALASGGAVVISQYIGRTDHRDASRSAGQLLLFSIWFSILLSILLLINCKVLLTVLFGKVDSEVMEACVTYLRISIYSFPMLAVYNAGASLCRSLGNTKLTLKISVVSNIVNFIGNLLGVFLFHMGVAGVAWPSFIARTLSAVWITILCSGRRKEVRYHLVDTLHLDTSLLKKILGIAIPNGIESGVFQLVKVALSSMVAAFGTYQIAANGISQSIWSLAAMVSVAMGPVFITVIGQCMGDRDIEGADYYFKKLLKVTVLLSTIWNLFILLLTPLFLRIYAIAPQTRELIFQLVLWHNILNSFAFPFSMPLGNGLRAAGDVKFTMYATLFTTIFVRFTLSWYFAIYLDWKMMGIAMAIFVDWGVRGIMQYLRYRNGKWKSFQVI